MQPALNPRPSSTKEPSSTHQNPYYSSSKRSEVVVLNRVFNQSSIRRGEVVCLNSPTSRKLIIKRVVGLEGDWIIKKDGFYVHVPQGQCWIEGDNQANSIDSNSFGPVPLGLIRATVPYVVWPLNKARAVSKELTEDAKKRLRLVPYR